MQSFIPTQRNKNFFFMFFVFLLTPLLSFADTSIISIQDAFKAALNHPKVQAKRNEAKAASEKLHFSEWQRFPSLSIQTSAAQASAMQTGATTVTTLRVEQPLWSFGRISSAIESSKARLEASEEAISEAEQEILFKTTNSFFSIIKNQKKNRNFQ